MVKIKGQNLTATFLQRKFKGINIVLFNVVLSAAKACRNFVNGSSCFEHKLVKHDG